MHIFSFESESFHKDERILVVYTNVPQTQREIAQRHYRKNRARIIAKVRAYYKANFQKIQKCNHRYYQQNSDKIKARTKIYKATRQEQHRQYNKKWRINNAESNKQSQRKYRLKVERTPYLKIKARLRKRMWDALKANFGGTISARKAAWTTKLIGCDFDWLIAWLEVQFKPGMTWENYRWNGWHIDHIKPCNSFDLVDPEQQKRCFHWTNLQPLWANENFCKGSIALIKTH